MKTIVLSGGGIYTYCLLGFLHRLKEQRLLDQVDTIVGSSIGSVVGFLLFIGYLPFEMFAIFDEMTAGCFNFDKNVSDDYGYDDASLFMKIVENAMERKHQSRTLTFSQLHENRGKRLVVTGSNVNKGIPCYFHYLSSPDMVILEALRISISLPILFTPILHKGDYYMDGSLYDHYPADFAEKFVQNADLGGMRIEIIKEHPTDNFVNVMFCALLGYIRKQPIHGKAYTVNMPSVEIEGAVVNPLDFALSIDDRRHLFARGYETTVNENLF